MRVLPLRHSFLPAAEPRVEAHERHGPTRFGSTFWLAGLPVRRTRSDTLVHFLRTRIAQDRKIAVGFVNQNFVVTCRHLRRRALDRGSVLLVNDGIGMQIAARLRLGTLFRENMNGTDFVPAFLRSAGPPLTVYLVGCEPSVLTKAAATIAAYPNCRVVGARDGFSLWEHEASVLADIAAAQPDVLLVGLGNPVQEQWILDRWAQIDARVIFGVGALFEWISGHRRRAPPSVRQFHLEWLYRLMLEPRRLWNRYTLGILHFFLLVLLHSGGRAAARNAP